MGGGGRGQGQARPAAAPFASGGSERGMTRQRHSAPAGGGGGGGGGAVLDRSQVRALQEIRGPHPSVRAANRKATVGSRTGARKRDGGQRAPTSRLFGLWGFI